MTLLPLFLVLGVSISGTYLLRDFLNWLHGSE